MAKSVRITSNCQQTVSKIRIEKKKRKKFTLSVASKLKKTQDLNFLEINFRFLVIYSLTWPKYKIQPISKPFSFQMQLIWSLKFFGIFGGPMLWRIGPGMLKNQKNRFLCKIPELCKHAKKFQNLKLSDFFCWKSILDRLSNNISCWN
jgi:hypothetical protein